MEGRSRVTDAAPWKLIAFVFFLEAALIDIGFAWAVAWCDPHLFNRIGALITACAAGLIVWQIGLEMTLEAQRHAGVAQADNRAGLSPIMARAMARATAKMWARNERQYRSTRLRVAAFVAVNAVLGEMLHGFGDLFVLAVRACGAP